MTGKVKFKRTIQIMVRVLKIKDWEEELWGGDTLDKGSRKGLSVEVTCELRPKGVWDTCSGCRGCEQGNCSKCSRGKKERMAAVHEVEFGRVSRNRAGSTS